MHVDLDNASALSKNDSLNGLLDIKVELLIFLFL
jgi:hypothetical protein